MLAIKDLAKAQARWRHAFQTDKLIIRADKMIMMWNGRMDLTRQKIE